MVKLYGYKRCSTCRKAEKWLENHQIDFEFIDITLNPPKKSNLKAIHRQSEKEIKKLFNTSGVVYREKNIKDQLKTLSNTDCYSLLASDGKLIKRPIVTDGNKVTIGFNESEFSEIWV